MTAAEIARALGGALEGDGSVAIAGVAGLREAARGDLSFLSNPRYAAAAAATAASAVIVGADWHGACPCAVIRVQDPERAFAQIVGRLAPPPPPPPTGVHPTAVIAPGVRLGQSVSLGPYCVVEEGVRVGDRTVLYAGCYLGYHTAVGADCRFYPHVTVREYTRIGDRAIVHNGAVIGSDGFGYEQAAGAWKKIPQVGVVEIGDDVEIGANVTIDRARFGKTVIGNGVKIDNLVQVAHNVRVGDHTAMAALVGIAGSSIVGHHVQVGGQAGIGGHLTVGDHAVVGAQAGVTKDVPPKTYVSGYPAMPHDKAATAHAHMMRLPQLKEKVAEMEKRLAALEEKARG
jgi:UDP-3-O-[3-hydroxymyristoyl] glucosamine N-acyltransferase